MILNFFTLIISNIIWKITWNYAYNSFNQLKTSLTKTYKLLTVKLQTARMHNWLNDWLIEYWIKSKIDWLNPFIQLRNVWLIAGIFNKFRQLKFEFWSIDLRFLFYFKIVKVLFISLIFVPTLKSVSFLNLRPQSSSGHW